MKRVLIIGCGSIGRRHIRVLKKLDGICVGAYRTKAGFCKELPEDLKEVTEFFSEEEAFEWAPDYMVISNPTSLHLEYLLKGIANKVDNIFVEKPLAVNYSDVEREDLLDYGGNIAVGFNLRFHPVIKKIKEIIESGECGKVLKAGLEVGQYLSFWHPDEDYRNIYAAKKELGGGVLRTLCHEIDLARYLFGDFRSVYGEIGKISDLEIDVEDNVSILADMNGELKLEINLDYLRPVPERRGDIFFKKGLLRYDARALKIEYADYENREWRNLLSLDSYDADIQYQEEMKAFIGKDFSRLCTLKEGIEVMKIIDIAERSSREKRMLCLN